jgi:hypothetical protein
MTTVPAKKPTRPRRAGAAAEPQLPKLTLGKFDEAAQLLERMARENVTTFVEAQSEFLEAHRESSKRPLSHDEAVQLAAAAADAMDADPTQLATAAAQLQASDLRAYDQPQVKDVLLAAGAATAPAFLQLAKRFLALIELPTEAFEQAREDDTLEQLLDTVCDELDREGLAEVRARAGRAFGYFAQEAGIAGPKVWATLVETIMGALAQAARMSGLEASASSSLTSSAERTEAEPPDSTSSTESPSTA